MSQESSHSGRVYRVGPSLQIVLGVFLTVFAGFGVTIGLKNGDWTFLAVIVGLASAVFFSCSDFAIGNRPLWVSIP